jgi:hypothetical protein
MGFQFQSNGQQDLTFKNIVPIINIQGNEHDYIIDEEVDHNEDCGEESAVELLHIPKII